jgi:pyridoxine 5-phosphate synthase
MRLYVNVDHVATVRQARRTIEPDPVAAAALCERGGADGITVHLREDRRHIHDEDVRRLSATIRTVLNLELATADDILALAVALTPHQATLVPERRAEITTEGGLPLGADAAADRRMAAAVRRLADAGIRVSLFVDPERAVVERSAALGAHAVELHTGRYCHAFPNAQRELAQLADAARHARAAGLAVHAGHGLNYVNVAAVASLPEVEELNIGHSIVSRAIFVGIERAVAEMRAAVDAARVDQPSAGP